MLLRFSNERCSALKKNMQRLETQLVEADNRLSDTNEVRKNELKAIKNKEEELRWMSYELRAFRHRCSKLQDQKDQRDRSLQLLQMEVETLRRRLAAQATTSSPPHPAPAQGPGLGHGLGGTSSSHSPHGGKHPPPPTFRHNTSPSQGRTTPVPLPLPPGHTGGGVAGSTPNASPGTHGPGASSGTGTGEGPGAGAGAGAGSGPGNEVLEGTSVRGNAQGGALVTGVTTPDHLASDGGSDFDDEYYGDEQYLEAGVDFDGVTKDIEAIRQGKMPESMQLVARLNVEAGGKVSVFDRLASTTTESRRQKVNDRDQLHESLRRKAKTAASRKRKEFKVPAHPPPVPTGSGGASSGPSSLSASSLGSSGGLTSSGPGNMAG
ncbi:unnamed protein product, partial [Discosporangium mesarthrocarpum]